VDTGTFANVVGLTLDLLDAAGTPAATYPVQARGTETVLVLGELYRRQGAWKLRAIGQGYDTGLAGLATDYGVTIEEAPEPPVPAAAPTFAPPGVLPVAPAPGPAPARAAYPDEQTMRLPRPQDDPDTAGLPPEMGARISLRKETVRVTLEKKGLGGVRARVAIVLDRSGSMKALYNDGVVGRLVERMAPVAAKLDNDGELDAWIFADDCAALPSLRVPDLPRWIDDNVYINSKGNQLPPRPGPHPVRVPDHLAHVRGGNDEPRVIRDILRRYVNEPGDPVLVLFFSDGGVNRSRQIRELLVDAARYPIFWQFVGLGRSEYGILERFDTMPGRVVDNAGFFCVDDIDRIGDGELYDRILGEFPQWLAEARRLGIVR
jgi:hypothetical protein